MAKEQPKYSEYRDMDEPVNLPDDAEQVLAALVAVDPEAEPSDDDEGS